MLLSRCGKRTWRSSWLRLRWTGSWQIDGYESAMHHSWTHCALFSECKSTAQMIPAVSWSCLTWQHAMRYSHAVAARSGRRRRQRCSIGVQGAVSPPCSGCQCALLSGNQDNTACSLTCCWHTVAPWRMICLSCAPPSVAELQLVCNTESNLHVTSPIHAHSQLELAYRMCHRPRGRKPPRPGRFVTPARLTRCPARRQAIAKRISVSSSSTYSAAK